MKKAPTAAARTRFRKLLFDWHRSRNRRVFSWTGEKDPYRIWLREVILQQTRVEQGLAYYESFTRNYPGIGDLAGASDDEVFRLWEGLGYYSRCRNLLQTAREIVRERNGVFPQTRDELARLRGVGPYTAAAIASFAFDQPHAVVDGNVYRVLSRVFGIREAIDSANGKKLFAALAQELLDPREPAEYNQAIMDFGAVVCRPDPDCSGCVFASLCVARREGITGELPVKSAKPPVRQRWFHYLVFQHRGRVAIRQRQEKDIWQGLYEFPMLEGKNSVPTRKLIPAGAEVGERKTGSQRLSHQHIHASFTRVTLKNALRGNWIWIPTRSLTNYSFPRVIRRYIDEEGQL